MSEAFHPIVDGKITYGRRVNKLSYDEKTKKTSISWYEHDTKTTETKTYDKTIVAVPFSVARLWRLPKFNPIIKEAITGLGYSYACKVSVSMTLFCASFAADIVLLSSSTRLDSGSTLSSPSSAVVDPPTCPESDPSATPLTTSTVPVPELFSPVTPPPLDLPSPPCRKLITSEWSSKL